MNFTVAIRLKDGRKQLFRLDGAKDLDDARAYVWEQIKDVATILVAERSKPDQTPAEERAAA